MLSGTSKKFLFAARDQQTITADSLWECHTKNIGSNSVYGSHESLWVPSKFMGPMKVYGSHESLWVPTKVYGSHQKI